ncbi:DNA internalization-related competence protein ComEC/Rec2 [Massilia sp. 9096]|uniref:DNA internalization-related competence protein ComEC/Rec2 n=1 Tax=Massilia sp. 9096 TaxID=1500894 RepID=UPI0005671BBC|nr:DNA internalization-related competence protein ComEC/Rec2 [Massilia sp. 9096]
MRSAILGFVAGAFWLQNCATLPSTRLQAACALAALLVLLLVRAYGHGRAGMPTHVGVRAGATLLAGVLSGYAWAALLAQAALTPHLAPQDEGRDLAVVGVVESLPYVFEQGVRFNFRVERALEPGLELPPHLALAWYAADASRGGGRRSADSRPVPALRPGERWQLTLRLQRPHGNANPGGFDYEAWLLEQGLRATGYVRAGPGREDADNRRLDAFVPSAGAIVERVRALLRARILHALAGKTYAPVIVALVIGDQRGIGQSDWQMFNRTGIGHLISISGLHITMIAGLAALGVSALWRRSFFTGLQLPLRLPAQKVAALAGAGTALAYVLLAGFGVPAQRTLYMLAVVALALWTGRSAAVSHVLCCALGIVVLLDPWAVLWPGFWLSFGAVAILLYAGHGRIGPAARALGASLIGVGRTQWAVTAGMVPLSMLLFAQVSLVSPLANAIAIPLVSFVVTPLALAGSLLPDPLCGWLLHLAHAAVAALAALLAALSNWPAAVWRAPAPSWWVFGFALAGTLWLLAPRGWPLRWTGVLAWLPLLLAAPDTPERGDVRVTAFDVGQGMALLVETAGHRLLYDTGPGYAPGSDAGSRVILPYLRKRGIVSLDGMVISHADADHSGGAPALLAELDVGWLASSLGDGHPALQAARRPLRCMAGQQWTWDGVRFTMLHPPAASYLDAGLKTNARSCVLRIDDGRHPLLLAGDIEAAQEAALVAAAAGALRADVLLAPHHGSGTSSSPDFLQAVAPEVGVFQVGWRNRYRHPKAQVYARYGELGVARLRTDELGALTLDFGAEVQSSGYRMAHARYWYSH